MGIGPVVGRATSVANTALVLNGNQMRAFVRSAHKLSSREPTGIAYVGGSAKTSIMEPARMRHARIAVCIKGSLVLLFVLGACRSRGRDADPFAARFVVKQAPYVRGLRPVHSLQAPPPDSAIEPQFTLAQATDGARVYGDVCARCHSVTQWSGAAFAASWQARRVSDFHDLVSATMPQDNPGSLSAKQYLDVTAYVLQQAGFLSGSRPLTADTATLRRARLVLTPKPSVAAPVRS